MLRIENYSLFFVPAHTVTLRGSLRTIIILTTASLCPKTKLKWSVANSKSQATTLLATIRQQLRFSLTDFLAYSTCFTIWTPQPPFTWRLPVCSKGEGWILSNQLAELANFSKQWWPDSHLIHFLCLPVQPLCLLPLLYVIRHKNVESQHGLRLLCLLDSVS